MNSPHFEPSWQSHETLGVVIAGDPDFEKRSNTLWERYGNRRIRVAARLEGVNELGLPVYEDEGDEVDWLFWPTADPDERQVGTWSPVFAALVSSAAKGGKSVLATPVRDKGWGVDERLEPLLVKMAPGHNVEAGDAVLVVNGTDETDRGAYLAFAGSTELIAHWRAGSGDAPDIDAASSIVKDYAEGGKLSLKARLSTAFYLAPVGDPPAEGSVTPPFVKLEDLPHTLACNWTETTPPVAADSIPGGLILGRTESGEGDYSSGSYALGYLSSEFGGPFYVGPIGGKRVLGIAPDGMEIHAVRLKCQTANHHYDDSLDGPLGFEPAAWSPGDITPYRMMVRFRFDFGSGAWRWFSYSYLNEPRGGPPLQPPVDEPTPLAIPEGGGDQPLGGGLPLTGQGTGDFPPQDVAGACAHVEVCVSAMSFKGQRTWDEGNDIRYTSDPSFDALENYTEQPVVALLGTVGKYERSTPVYSEEPGLGRNADGSGQGLVGITPPERDLASYRSDTIYDYSTVAASTPAVALFDTRLALAGAWDKATGLPVSAWILQRQADGSLTVGAIDSSGTPDAGELLNVLSFVTLASGVNVAVRAIGNGDSPYTVPRTDNVILVDTTAGNVTITLPAANDCTRQLTICNVAGGNNVTVQRAGSDLLDDGTTNQVLAPGQKSAMQSDGSSVWVVLT